MEYILNDYCAKNTTGGDPKKDTKQYLLDVGTGNGALLFKLIKKEIPTYFNLVGMDYSENSITLAKRV